MEVEDTSGEAHSTHSQHSFHNWKSAQLVNSHLVCDPTIRQPPSATVVSAEPFSHGTGTRRCLQKEMATYRHWSVSLWRDPDDVSHCRILSPDKTEWWLTLATLCGWRRCFVADQLSFMTRIREEEEVAQQGGDTYMDGVTARSIREEEEVTQQRSEMYRK